MRTTVGSRSLRGGLIGGPNPCCRKREPQDATMWPILRGPYAPAMGFEYRAADRQSHSHTFRLGCNEGLEDLICLRQLDPGACVGNRNQHVVSVLLTAY